MRAALRDGRGTAIHGVDPSSTAGCAHPFPTKAQKKEKKKKRKDEKMKDEKMKKKNLYAHYFDTSASSPSLKTTQRDSSFLQALVVLLRCPRHRSDWHP